MEDDLTKLAINNWREKVRKTDEWGLIPSASMSPIDLECYRGFLSVQSNVINKNPVHKSRFALGESSCVRDVS